MQVLGPPKLFRFGECELDVDRKVLRRGGEIVSLPLKAVELMSVLVENRGQVVSKEELIGRVWADAFVEDSVLTQNIYLLRKTLRSVSPASSIRNVPRRGYVFESPVDFETEAVIERHLYERVEIDEIDDVIEESTVPTQPTRYRHRWFLFLSVATGAILLGSAMLFYFRPGPGQNAAIAPAPSHRLSALSSTSRIKFVSVLPFRNTAAELGADFANDIAIRLGSKNKFFVRPVSLVSEYAQHDAANANDVVLDGSVQMDEGRFSAAVRLIEPADGTEIWSERFEYDNLVQLQDAIANKAAAIIADRMTSGEREIVSRRLPTNLAAYENYQTGYLLWRRRNDGTAYFQRAVELDQNFASAYAFLASSRAMQGVKGSPAAIEAEKFLKKALELDENLAEAHAVQGFIRIFHQHDWSGAEISLRAAIELDGNNANARHWMGVLHSINRRLEDAKVEMRRTLDIDPTNPTILADIGQVHYFEGELELAREHINRSLNIDSTHVFARSYMVTLDSPATWSDNDMLRDLERAAVEKGFVIPFINVDPRYSRIRDTARFQKIVRDLQFAPR